MSRRKCVWSDTISTILMKNDRGLHCVRHMADFCTVLTGIIRTDTGKKSMKDIDRWLFLRISLQSRLPVFLQFADYFSVRSVCICSSILQHLGHLLALVLYFECFFCKNDLFYGFYSYVNKTFCQDQDQDQDFPCGIKWFNKERNCTWHQTL